MGSVGPAGVYGRHELTKFHTPAVISPEPARALGNTLGLRSIMLVGEVAQYENSYRLCYARGPGGIIVALAEELA